MSIMIAMMQVAKLVWTMEAAIWYWEGVGPTVGVGGCGGNMVLGGCGWDGGWNDVAKGNTRPGLRPRVPTACPTTISILIIINIGIPFLPSPSPLYVPEKHHHCVQFCSGLTSSGGRKSFQ